MTVFKTVLEMRLPRPVAVLMSLVLSYGTAVAATDTLNTVQKRLLNSAASAFAQGDYRPAANALPELENTYMGPWVGYWSLQPRLKSMTQDQYQRYAKHYPSGVAHHLLRQQWLLELARREDWSDFTQVFQAGSIPDLISLRCDAARDPLLSTSTVVAPFFLWSGAAANDHACNAMARAYLEQGQITPPELWRRLQQMYEASAFDAALRFAPFLPAAQSGQLGRTVTAPAAWISRQIQHYGSHKWPTGQAHLLVLALLRLAATHPAQAVQFVRTLGVLSAADKSLVL
ncbi:lytic transglycosylase domain-containing protein, partial [Acidithiobacillus ferriphilus]|nr:lytic transglycosylase domain-containing protein [Acidithiobacillus ferriphilus]